MDENLKPSGGRTLLKVLKFVALGVAAVTMMIVVGAVLLVGFLAYACGHH